MSEATVTLKESAAILAVTSTRAVRYILQLRPVGECAIAVGYDSRGRLLLRRDLVEAEARSRASRGNWRKKNLGSFVMPAPRNREGSRLCYRLNCRSVVAGRARLCPRHRG